MFYKMNQIFYLAVASILLASIVSFAIPNAVQAAPKFGWCYTAASIVCGQAGDNFGSKGECKKAQAEEPTTVVESCHKVPIA